MECVLSKRVTEVKLRMRKKSSEQKLWRRRNASDSLINDSNQKEAGRLQKLEIKQRVHL